MTDAIAPPSATPGNVPQASAINQGFWAVSARAFARSHLNKVAVSFIAFLIVITITVPFIANGQPFTIVLKSSDGLKRAYPLFSTLSNIDLSVIVAGLAFLVSLIACRLITRQPLEVEQRTARQTRFVLITFAAAASIIVSFFAFHSPYNSPYDYRDYQSMIKRGDASDAVFTLIPWHYADQEPLGADLTYQYPTREHLLGTDQIGRDALSRLLWSTRIVLGIGFISITIAVVIGVIIGALIGHYSGKVDLLGMRLVEIFESIPTFFLILIFIAIYGRQIFIIMVILGLTGWTGIARFVRAEFLKLRKMDFVDAAKASGLPLHRVVFRHMLPNALTPVIVSFTFGVAGAIASESGLSFLGVGVEPPLPSWGQMLNDAGNPAETFRPWLALAPGLMIFLTVFAYNIIGEGLRDAIDPRTNRVR